MSITSSLDINLILKGRVSALRIIHCLIDSGWTFTDYNGSSYLPLGDKGDFKWKTENLEKNDLISIFLKKEECGELVGVVMTWQDSMIGISLLLFNDGLISCMFDINRKKIKNTDITDVSWYLEKILPCLNNANLNIESFEYREHV